MSAETEAKEQRRETPRHTAIKHPNLRQSHNHTIGNKMLYSPLVRVCKHQATDSFMLWIFRDTQSDGNQISRHTHTFHISLQQSCQTQQGKIVSSSKKHQTSNIKYHRVTHTASDTQRPRRSTHSVFNPSKCVLVLWINIRHLILNVTDR